MIISIIFSFCLADRWQKVRGVSPRNDWYPRLHGKSANGYHPITINCSRLVKARGVLEWSISACMASSNCTGYCLDSYQPPVVKVSSGFVFLPRHRSGCCRARVSLSSCTCTLIHDARMPSVRNFFRQNLVPPTSLFLAVQTYIWYIFHSSS